MKGYVFFANLKKKNEGGMIFGTSDKELEQGLLEVKEEILNSNKLKINILPYSKASYKFTSFFEIE